MVASHLPSRPAPLSIVDDREYIRDPLIELLAIQLYLVSPQTTEAAERPWPSGRAAPRPWVEIGLAWRNHFRAVARGKEPLE